MNIYQETKYIMNKYKVHPNKKIGQNFLFDEDALNKITEGVKKSDTIIEIGPGLGTLTAILAKKAEKVIAIEIDKNMIEILNDRFKFHENVKILNKDILSVNIDEIAPNAKVIANLPYYITTPIITKLLKTNIKDITVLIQKEVADRICLEPGERGAGAITYFVNYYSEPQVIANVERELFIPAPEVESSIVKLNIRKEKKVKVHNEKLFFEIIKTNFSQRRKTILNSLDSIISKEKLKNILEELQIDSNIRGESLTLEQYAQISNKIG